MPWLEAEAPDVLCLQEIKASRAQVPEQLASLAGYHAHWHGSGGYSGVALLLRQVTFPAPPAFVHPPFDLEHRIVVATIGRLVLGSVYVPNGGKDLEAKMTFLRELAVWAGVQEAAGKHLVLCGDFNVARTPVDVHPTLRNDVVGQSRDERALIEALFATGLVDVGRYVDPDNDRLFTWWAPWRDMRQRNIGWRLDYIAAHNALVDRTAVCWVARDVGTSDHAPVVAHLRDVPEVAPVDLGG